MRPENKLTEEQYNKNIQQTYENCLLPDEKEFLCPALCGEEPVPNKEYKWDCFVDEMYCKSFNNGEGCKYIKFCPAFNKIDLRIKGGEEDEL